jgi:tetratricopeptide (TPR) repeat protein
LLRSAFKGFFEILLKSFEARDSTIYVSRYYEKGVHDLTFAIIDRALEMNKSDMNICSWLFILKGDLLVDKAMYLYKNNAECRTPFEKSIEEFDNCIRINPFNSIAWLGKSFSYQMIGLIYATIDKNEIKGNYYFHQAIFSADAGLGALEEEGFNAEREHNLWAMKGSAFYFLDNYDEGDKCFNEADVDVSSSNDSSK